MKVLIVCSYKSQLAGGMTPFIMEQARSVEKTGVEVDYFLIKGKGISGYLKNYGPLRKKIAEFMPDIIHAHYGLSGLFANLQRRVPVVTTYHGSDIHNPKVFPFSRLCMMLSAKNIFVSVTPRTPLEKGRHIPCGVDLKLFVPMDTREAREKLGLDMDQKYVLFAGAFQNAVKNAALAQATVKLIPDVELLELKGYTRDQVVLLMNAVDAVLMTSFTEGSPQFIKEAMACNCPVVSVPVGDVPDVLREIKGCYISTYEPADVADQLKQALAFGKRTDGRKRIDELGLDLETIARRIIEIYKTIVRKCMT